MPGRSTTKGGKSLGYAGKSGGSDGAKKKKSSSVMRESTWNRMTKGERLREYGTTSYAKYKAGKKAAKVGGTSRTNIQMRGRDQIMAANPVKRRHGQEVHKSVWTTANKKKVIEMFGAGATVIEVCRFLGIHKATFYRWLKDERKSDFQRTIELGIQASEAHWIQVGRDNLENKSFNTSLYAFMMVNKFNYRSTYSKQEVDKTETKKTTVEVKKAVDVESIIDKLQESMEEKPELLN